MKGRGIGRGGIGRTCALVAFSNGRLPALPPARIEVPADRPPFLAGADDLPLALIDQGDTDDELVRAVVDWLAELYAGADARRMAEVLIEKARRRPP